MNITERHWTDWRDYKWKSDPFQREIRIRLSIFTITGVCAGLPALVWSVRYIIHHRKNGHRISIFIILLLLTDFLELFLSPYILIKFILNEFSCSMNWTCWIFRDSWWAIKDCGFLLNQLVGLEGERSVKYPRYTASVFSSLCFRIVLILFFICVIIGRFFWERVVFLLFRTFVLRSSFLAFLLFMTIWLLILCIIIFGVKCSADRHSHTSRKSDCHISVIYLITELVFLVQYLFVIFRFDFWGIPVYLISLRLISDPLLCVLVCRQNLRLQAPQNPERQVESE